MSVFIEATDLCVSVGNKPLLTNINLQFKQGDYLCILGPNGAGKSTLIKTLIGMIKPQSGEVKLNQQPLLSLSQKQIARQISYVPQMHDQTLNFSVLEFIKMGRYAYHSAMSAWSLVDEEAMNYAVETTKVTPFLNRQISSLSGGERQRIMIAAALCQQSPLLILDEPTSFLDPHHQVEVHHLICELNQQHNISIIEVSHDLNHAAYHSESIIALKDGREQWSGASGDFLQAENLNALYEQRFVFTTHPETGAVIALPSELI